MKPPTTPHQIHQQLNYQLPLQQSQQQQQQQQYTGSSKEDPDKLFRSGIEAITEAFERKTYAIMHEVAHWKQVAAAQKQQLISAEQEKLQLQRKLGDFEKAISELQLSKKQLQMSKNAVLEKYNVLRKNAIQLDSFRKQIVNMIEFSPAANFQIPDAEASFVDINNAVGMGGAIISDGNNGNQLNAHGISQAIRGMNAVGLDSTSGFLNGIGSGGGQGNNNNNNIPMNMMLMDDNSFNVDFKTSLIVNDGKLETLHLTPFKPPEETSPIKKTPKDINSNKYGGEGALNGNSFTSVTEDSSSMNIAEANKSIDAPSLYKKIRSILSTAEFDRFATTIAQFNSGVKTANETIQIIRDLVKDQRLVNQMTGLIMRAIAETSQDFSNHKMQQQSNNNNNNAISKTPSQTQISATTTPSGKFTPGSKSKSQTTVADMVSGSPAITTTSSVN